MANRTKQPHYVPTFYLDGFADERGLVHVFDTGQRKAYSGSPKEVATQGGIYEGRFVFDEHEMSGEDLFGAIESKARPIRDKLLVGTDLSAGERWDFAWFMASISTRTPEALKRVEAIESKALTSMLLFDPAAALEHEPPPGTKAAHLRNVARLAAEGKIRIVPGKPMVLDAMLSWMDAIVTVIHLKDWLVHRAPSGRTLVTSDNPFCFVAAPGSEGRVDGPSPMDENAQWIFPLTSGCVLQLFGNGGSLRWPTPMQETIDELMETFLARARGLLIGASREIVDELGATYDRPHSL